MQSGVSAACLPGAPPPDGRCPSVLPGISTETLAVLGTAEALDGEDVLPGFACRLHEILT